VGQSVGGMACTTCRWYDYNCCLRNSPAGLSINSVPLRYRPCAHSGILFDHAQNLLLYVLVPRSSRFLPVRSRRKRSLLLRQQCIGSKIFQKFSIRIHSFQYFWLIQTATCSAIIYRELTNAWCIPELRL